jgi:nucleotide-binding universal stress UspA family protein
VYEHILVALDGSALGEQTLPHVEVLAEKFGSRITLLRATTPLETIIVETNLDPDEPALIDPTELEQAEQEDAREYLEDVASRLRGRGLQVEIEIPEESAVDAILERAEALNASLIAMTTHGHSGLGHLFFGSVSDGVVRKAHCPVLLVHVTEPKD